MVLTVTGATGCVGRAVVQRAVALGHTVRPLSQRSSLEGGASLATPAVLTENALVPHLEGADAVVHLAAKVHVRDPSPVDIDEFWRVNVDGTEAVVRAAERAGVGRVVLASTVGVYAPCISRPIRDGDPTAPLDAYAQSKLAAERVVLSGGRPGAVVLRLCVVSGPGDRGNIRRMIEAIDRHRFIVVGQGDNPKTLLSSANAADRLLRAAGTSLQPGPWIAADPQTWNLRQIAGEIARLLARLRPIRLPRALALAAGQVLDRASAAAGRRTLLATALSKLAQPTHFSGDALDRELGCAPPLSTADGLARAVDAYRLEALAR